MKLTPWFDALKHNPVRDGWYDFRFGFGGVWVYQRYQWKKDSWYCRH